MSSANGTLSVADPDTGEAMFQMPAVLVGSYGDFASILSAGRGATRSIRRGRTA